MKKNISIILAPFSIGGPNEAAKDGPAAMMKSSLIQDLQELNFNLKIIKPPKSLMNKKALVLSSKKNRIKNIDAIIKINEWLAEAVAKQLKEGYLPLTIGGDHCLGIGTIAGVVKAIGDIGVIWIDRHFDAHSPMNTVSWRAHGMPAAVATVKESYDPHPDFQRLLKVGAPKRLPKVKPENFVHFAIGEKSRIKPKTKSFLMEDIDNVGIKKSIDDAIDYLLKKVRKIYIAWDIDSLNVTGTGTSGDSQLSLREGLVIARSINKKIREKDRLAGFEMMEIAPRLEKKHLKGQTVDWAVQTIATSFGDDLFNNFGRMTRNINMHAEDL